MLAKSGLHAMFTHLCLLLLLLLLPLLFLVTVCLAGDIDLTIASA